MRLIKSNSLTYIHWRKYEDHTFSPFFPEISGSLHSSGFRKSRIRGSSNSTKFDKVADVIVIGSGFAGLAAALEAKEKGASVMLLEKMPAYGGNSAINGGAFAVAGSPLQEKKASRTLLNSCSRT